MIDTHAHIDTDAFDSDRGEMLERAFAAGVEHIIIPAIQPAGFDKLFEVVYSCNQLSCAVGIHPHHALEADESEFEKIERLCSNKKVVAVGEAGLDYYYDFAPKDIQRDVFRRQLQIAKSAGLPVIVHNRDSDDDLIKIIEQEQDGKLRGVLHCFSSSLEFMKKAFDLGFIVSFTGNITFKKIDLSECIKYAPIENIMLETDAPYMTPVPYRGKRNEPAYVRFTAEKIAEYKSLTIEEVISMTTKNAKKLFNLLLILLCFLLSTASILAQDEENIENTTEAEEFVHPYDRLFGIGIFVGANTVTRDEKLPDQPEKIPDTDEGILTFGGAISFQAADYLNLELAYVYSKNNEVARKNNYQIKPTINNIFEFDAQWIVNPYNVINFYGVTGVVAFFNDTEKGKYNRYGINYGIGVCGNIRLPGNAGLIVLAGEIRINHQFGEEKLGKYYKQDVIEIQATTFYSIPRFTLYWYPKF